jgi:hypothetical protein
MSSGLGSHGLVESVHTWAVAHTLQRIDTQLAHVLAAEAQVAEDCLRDVSDDDAIGAVVETSRGASQRLLATWRAQVAAAPRETARRRRHREARAARLGRRNVLPCLL